ncbi:MAG: tetratricopeptide repeat protein [Syntrophales bacterium]
MKTTHNSSSKKDKRKSSDFLTSVLVASVTFVLLARVLNADFLNWDDNWLIYENSKLGPLDFSHIWSILNNDYFSSAFYTPLAGLRFCIIYTLAGLKPFAYHLANLLFHVINTVLLFMVVKKLALLSLGKQQSIMISNARINLAIALAVLIWSLNPLMVEPTALVAAGPHAQAVSFMLLSLLSYMRANETGTRAVRWLTASVVFYGASILSQLITLTFPFILLILDVYPLKRISIERGSLKPLVMRQAILEKIPFIIITFIIVAVDLTVLNKSQIGHHVSSLAEFGLLDRAMQAFYVYAYYLWRPWYPFNLSPVYLTLYSFDPLSIPFIASAFGVVGCSILILMLRHRYPSIIAAWLCYLILLIPVLGLNVHPHYTSDRYAMSVFMIWSVLLAGWIITARKPLQNFVISGIVLILIFFGIISYKQVTIWYNTDTLCRYMLDKTKDYPNNPERALICDKLATYYLKNGSVEKSISALTEAINIYPETESYLKRGNAYIRLGNYKQAISDYDRAIEINPNYVKAYINRGNTYINLGNYKQAISDYDRAIEINPNYAFVYYNRSLCYANLGNQKQAIEDLKTAARLGYKGAQDLLRSKKIKMDD